MTTLSIAFHLLVRSSLEICRKWLKCKYCWPEFERNNESIIPTTTMTISSHWRVLDGFEENEIHEGKRKSSFPEQKRHLKSATCGRFKIVSGFPASPEVPAPPPQSPSLLPAWLPAAPLGPLIGWQSGHWPGDPWQLTDLLLCLKTVTKLEKT